MRVYLSLGSNAGNKKEQIKKSILHLKKISKKISLKRISPLFETPALLPSQKNIPEHWNEPYINAVIELKIKQKSSSKKNTIHLKEENAFKKEIDFLFQKVKEIEKKLGRSSTKKNERGAPRLIDIDLLYSDEISMNTPYLTLPHKDLKNRSFVLTPLSFLNPHLFLDETKKKQKQKSTLRINQTISLKKKQSLKLLSRLRFLRNRLPLWMAIINVTPDSFSDGGKVNHLKTFKSYLKKLEEENVHIIDLGAESTRPNASALNPEEEWKRLLPYLNFLKNHYKDKILKPLISLDTRFAKSARKALNFGIDWINDVSGLKDPEMISVLQSFPETKYILTHSLCTPVNPKIHIPFNQDPIETLKRWLDQKLNLLEKNGINLNRIIFDPGIGFGKTTFQSLEILRRIKEFQSFPVFLMIGHSRKSFMNSFAQKNFSMRDYESLGISFWLLSQGIDILRVHDVVGHIKAFRGWSHVDLNPLYLDE